MAEPQKELQIQPEKNNDSNVFEAGARAQLKPIGASGTELFAGYFTEEYLQLLRGRKGAKQFDEMRRSESQISMLMGAVMNPIKAGCWEFEASTEVADGEMHKAFIEYNAKEMIDWDTHLHEALTFLVFGYSLFEVVNNVVFNHPKFGTFNGLKGLAFRSQKTIERWHVDNSTGELQCVEQWVQGDLAKGFSQMPKMLAEFLLLFTLHKEGDNYEGLSSLRPMYGPWFRKNLYHKLTGIGVEKAAIGTPMGTIPAGKQTADQVAEFKEMLSNFTAHEQAYIVKPAGWEVEILEGKFDAAKIKELIIMENTEMINSLVANFLALGTNGGGGAYALGSDLSDFFLTGIQTYANLIAGVWNRKLIPNLIKLNFGEQIAYPKLKATGINDKAGKELAEILGTLMGNNAVKPDMKLEEFLRKSYNLPKADLATMRDSTKASAPGAAPVNPNLPATEAGSELDVQKLSLNGAQVASLLSIVQQVVLGLLPRESAVQMIESAFSMTTDQANKILGKVGKGFIPNPNSAAQVSLSERTIKLAEGYKAQWNENKKSTKELMQENLNVMLEDLKAQIAREYKKAAPAQKISVGLKVNPKTSDYQKALQEVLAEVANDALLAARKVTPKAARNVKLAERITLAAPKGGFFSALPFNIQQLVRTQAAMIAQTQGADLSKVVIFQYGSSQASTESLDQILADIDAAAAPTIEGSTAKGISVDAAAGNAVSTVYNQAQLSWFFEPEVLETIESFTFYNEDPVSEICQELDGTTWAVNDPDLDRYSPPLHHNCKSRLVPNEKGSDKNPEIDRGGTSVSEKALKSITLCECDYHLRIYLSEAKLEDFTADEQKKISAKIALLIGEGKKQDEATAIAYDMARRSEL